MGAERTSDTTTMTAQFHFVGAMTLMLVLGGCASHVQLATASLEQSGGGTSPGAGSTPGTDATESGIPEPVSRGPLPLVVPGTLRSTTGVMQNQDALDRPLDEPLTTQSFRRSPEPSDSSGGETDTGQLSYPAPMEREALKAPYMVAPP